MLEDTYKYNSVDVAKYIVALCNKEHFEINMTKMQKLLYITYGSYLAVYNQRLTNEHPQAWPFGPVFPTTRNKLLHKDFYEITLNDIDNKAKEEMTSDVDFNRIIKLVLNEFGKWNASQLTIWSHKEGTPWFKTTKSEHFKWGSQIPDKFIAQFFNSIIIRE